MALKAPTLEDVARRAGVSTATVSRCLNLPGQVADATREKVQVAVNELGYAPNFSARSLVAKRTQTMGAIIPTMENAIFAEGVQTFQDVLQAAGFTLLIASSSYDPALEAQAIRTLVARGADGLLLIGHDRDPGLYDFLKTQGVPVIVAWAHAVGSSVVSIGFDNRRAMRELAEQAISLGHRRIGMISAHQATNDRARARVAGVRDALVASGIGSEGLIVEETEYGIANGGAAFERLMARVPDLTLVVAGNDVLAAGAIHRATELGIKVPDQVSVTGFDDINLARLVTPELTTVRVPHRAMGESAAQALIALVQGQKVRSQELVTELCLRGSLAAPAKL